MPGNDADQWGTVLNEFLRVAHHDDGSLRGTYGVINVKDFGATGDGITDDTSAIKAAVSKAFSSGKRVYLPSGKYRTTETVPVPENVSLVGDGSTSVIIHDPPLVHPSVAMNVEPTNPGIALNSILENFRILGMSGSGVGIKVVNGYALTIRNIQIDGGSDPNRTPGFTTAGVQVDGTGSANSAAVWILHSHIQNCGGDGVRLTGGSAGGVYIFFNRIQGNIGWGFNAAGGVTGPSEAHIENNVIEGNVKGAVTGSFFASTIRNNHFEASIISTEPLVKLGTDNMFRGLDISGNVVLNNTQVAAAGLYGFAIRPSGPSVGLTVSGNFFTQASVAAVTLNSVFHAVFFGNAKNAAVPLLVEQGWNIRGLLISDFPGTSFAGFVAKRGSDITLSNGANQDIDVESSSFTRVTGPTAAFSVGGFIGGSDGYELRILSTVLHSMTIKHEDIGSVPSNRINTMIGSDVVLPARQVTVSFIYDSASSRWIYLGYS
jgi:hypothetical protein